MIVSALLSGRILMRKDWLNANSVMRSLSGASPTSPGISKIKDYSKERKMTALELQHLKRKGKRIAMITAYDYPTAKHAENAGFEIVLVGDSLGMVVLGYETTQPVTMEDMIHHCKAVRRGAPSRFIVGDMPFGSYEKSVEQGLDNAFRLIKEAGMDAVKIEGAGKYKLQLVERLVDSGIAVMGHVGLTPQSISVLGGFRAQGRTAVKARQLIDEALQLQQAGAFSLVIECVPSVVAKAITAALQIPTIGIGAGPETSGQVLVYHDLLGVMHHPHHAKHVPSFCKQYANLGEKIHEALMQYKEEVHSAAYPTSQYSPYKMSEEEQSKFEELLLKDATDREMSSKAIDKKLREADEYEAIKLY